jgi:hypothetical protein
MWTLGAKAPRLRMADGDSVTLIVDYRRSPTPLVSTRKHENTKINYQVTNKILIKVIWFPVDKSTGSRQGVKGNQLSSEYVLLASVRMTEANGVSVRIAQREQSYSW